MATPTSPPSTQSAVVVKHAGKDWKMEVDHSYPVPTLEAGQALVRLSYTGVCHSDLSGINGSWDRKITCDVPGHEGVGRVLAYHPDTDPTTAPALGARVGVPLIRRPCTTCSICLLPDGEVMCPNTGFHGLQCNGTYQQYIAVYASYLVPLPEGKPASTSTSPQAIDDDALLAPVLCGGVTAYKALKKSGARAGDWVAVAGAGGGLGIFAVQYAAAMGMRVVAIDAGEQKRAATLRHGAAAFVDYLDGGVAAKVLEITGGEGAKAVLVLAPAEKTYNEALSYVACQGCVVCVGIPHEDVRMAVPPGLLMHRDVSIRGSMVGTRADIAEALDYVVRGLVKPDVVVHGMEDIVDIYKRMERNEVIGRAVLKL
ncbi:hypothetical protein QBC33DRAFT_592628 [Phialemonium atrogriseum]|uniref:Enoyl reductase (ER) domain-containing protein n=1 Tax=Phialemonium atrogriseum TaxID=1093897 RepID=A0AAJ0FT85_9PEZI|nr:uncharacterized protein QBC33DRAFT_592628 [Phialemonium atrogriseum]KAK1771900.1 hypothetical protein QBC33DRAFT_592628 [Phialemonium atrogriseum]